MISIFVSFAIGLVCFVLSCLILYGIIWLVRKASLNIKPFCERHYRALNRISNVFYGVIAALLIAMILFVVYGVGNKVLEVTK